VECEEKIRCIVNLTSGITSLKLSRFKKKVFEHIGGEREVIGRLGPEDRFDMNKKLLIEGELGFVGIMNCMCLRFCRYRNSLRSRVPMGGRKKLHHPGIPQHNGGASGVALETVGHGSPVGGGRFVTERWCLFPCLLPRRRSPPPAKVEEVRREVADLKAQLSDCCCPKVNESIQGSGRL
jgi:hypothetical protein